ncbi:hypothetical protein SAMN04490191_1250 [Pseudomonas lini]|uniref:Uncharacterized protein n=1 Tax=Pseudomonas lini TaxID=163011 RepID=A0A1H1RG31_9PSED|nr:hypothetical protein SAMN04490191_1250 [Pseudomonas lini]
MCGEGACPRWVAERPQNLQLRCIKYAARNDFATASQPNGGKPPRHTSPLPQGSVSFRSPMFNRAPLLTYNLIQVAFSSVYLSNACSDLSRPLPDCLKPPNGAVMSPPSY